MTKVQNGIYVAPAVAGTMLLTPWYVYTLSLVDVDEDEELDAPVLHPARNPQIVIVNRNKPAAANRLIFAEVMFPLVIFSLISKSLIQGSPRSRLERILESEL